MKYNERINEWRLFIENFKKSRKYRSLLKRNQEEREKINAKQNNIWSKYDQDKKALQQEFAEKLAILSNNKNAELEPLTDELERISLSEGEYLSDKVRESFPDLYCQIKSGEKAGQWRLKELREWKEDS